jgi:enoyl-CoA hydratase/carnithine racemase
MDGDVSLNTTKVLARKEAGIGWVVFNNPDKHNALSLEMSEGATAALRSFAADGEVRVVVLTGAGGKAFVSGADISEFEKTRSNAAQAERYSERGGTLYSVLHEMEKPTIAMIQGYCMGGGLALAAACDLRFASEDSQFAIPAAKLSIAYRPDFVRWVVDLVGPSRAKDILFSARRIMAPEALQIGLVNRVVPAGELDKLTRDYCATVAGNAPLSIRASKLTIDELSKPEREQDAAKIQRLGQECFDSEDFKEGRTAFMEKRKPMWKGR